MECLNSNVIGGCWEEDLKDIIDGGFIYLISLLTGEVNEIIRNAIFEKTSTVIEGVASFFFRKWSFQYPYLKN